MVEYVGCRIRFTDDDTGDTVTGKLVSMNKINGRLSIDEVECNGQKMSSTQVFLRDEISGLEVIEQKVEHTQQPSVDTRSVKLLKPELNTSHLKGLERVREADMLLSKQAAERGDDLIPCENCSFVSESVETTIHVITQLNDKFHQAIEKLLGEEAVGVSLQGVDVGRGGTLSLIQFGLRDCVIVFDITLLGRDAFKDGLTDVLHNPRIQKILHDCRYASDILFHQYGIKLVNVFDTQVADAVIFRIFDRRHRYPAYVKGVQHCMTQYLALEHQQFLQYRVRASCKDEDERVWDRRPLSRLVVEAAARSVYHLTTLRLAMLDHLLSEVRMGTDLYLGFVRDQPDQFLTTTGSRARRKLRQNHELPAEFQRIPESLVNEGLQSYRTCRSTDSGMAENCPNMDERENIVYSRVGAWFRMPRAATKKSDNERTELDVKSSETCLETRSTPVSPSNDKVSPAARDRKKVSPDDVNPLLEPSLKLQRCRLSSNMILPDQQRADSDTLPNVKPAGYQDGRPMKPSRDVVPLETEVNDEEEEEEDYGLIPSTPQTPVFRTSRVTTSDEDYETDG